MPPFWSGNTLKCIWNCLWKLNLEVNSSKKHLLLIKTCVQGLKGALKNFHFLTSTVNGGDFVMFSACSINWKLLVDSSYRNGPKTCTFYPSPMLYEYIDRRICLKPSLQGSNLLAIDKIEMGVTSSPLRGIIFPDEASIWILRKISNFHQKMMKNEKNWLSLRKRRKSWDFFEKIWAHSFVFLYNTGI